MARDIFVAKFQACNSITQLGGGEKWNNNDSRRLSKTHVLTMEFTELQTESTKKRHGYVAGSAMCKCKICKVLLSKVLWGIENIYTPGASWQGSPNELLNGKKPTKKKTTECLKGRRSQHYQANEHSYSQILTQRSFKRGWNVGLYSYRWQHLHRNHIDWLSEDPAAAAAVVDSCDSVMSLLQWLQHEQLLQDLRLARFSNLSSQKHFIYYRVHLVEIEDQIQFAHIVEIFV